MSLVERALQKLQASRPAPAPVSRGPAPATPPAAPLSAPAGRSAVPLLRSPEDLRAGNARLLHVDRERLRSQQMLPALSQEREISDQFRAIKRPLLNGLPAEQDETLSRTIMVASALPGDGKTFTSLNLALSLALEKDLRVLLVDADAPKPHLTRAFERQDVPGLLDALADPSRHIENVILPTDVPRLDFLPIGKWHDTANELLASERMRDVVQRLADMYYPGIVLFDSPPVLLTNESRALATFLGQVVLVVKSGVTPHQAVKEAIATLGDDRRISVVLNNAPLGGVLGHYYGYRYGYGATRGQPAAGAGRHDNNDST
jgi:exopolysaccharide/PEP-CTERM locus tyrosine autokinase